MTPSGLYKSRVYNTNPIVQTAPVHFKTVRVAMERRRPADPCSVRLRHPYPAVSARFAISPGGRQLIMYGRLRAMNTKNTNGFPCSKRRCLVPKRDNDVRPNVATCGFRCSGQVLFDRGQSKLI